MMKYSELKEIQTRRNTKPRKIDPMHASVKVRLSEKQYKIVKQISLEIKKPMAEVLRSGLFNSCSCLKEYTEKKQK